MKTNSQQFQERLHHLVEQYGEKGARERLKVDRSVFTRALAGLSLRAGSVALIAGALCAEEEQQTASRPARG